MVTASPLSAPIRASALCALATIVAIAIAAAEPLGGIPNPRTRDGTWVTDMPRALDAATVAQLNAMIDELERTTGAELAVVVVASLDGQSVEEFAEKLFKMWGIGKAGKDNGLLLLWSTGDRKVRIEVGYGLEGTIPDGKAGAILDAYVIPKFKAGQFDEGIIAGVAAVVMALGNQPVALPAVGTESYEEEEASPSRARPCWACTDPSRPDWRRSSASGAGAATAAAAARSARRRWPGSARPKTMRT